MERQLVWAWVELRGWILLSVLGVSMLFASARRAHGSQMLDKWLHVCRVLINCVRSPYRDDQLGYTCLPVCHCHMHTQLTLCTSWSAPPGVHSPLCLGCTCSSSM
eukprot:scaffold228325_cov26-Tisochrysis_lutea.AAC.2